MSSANSRLARLEAMVTDIRSDLGEIKDEVNTARARLHSLEATANAIVATQKANRAAEADQYRRLASRMQAVALVLSLAAIFSPLLVVLLAGK